MRYIGFSGYKLRMAIFCLLPCIMYSCNMSSQEQNESYMNHLANENSPYLLQHARNPVDWYPWGDEALEKARKEQKMLLISIGYAACHWCHVMEHESFEDSTVAAVMNEHFVCIKVDREERPDIDDVYMTACQLASGAGCGWPLNAFALPDGRPVWAGTYFPKDRWMAILDQFKSLWENDQDKLESYAKQLTSGIKAQDQIIKGAPQLLKIDEAKAMAENMISQVDKEFGGRKGAPKFPMPSNYRYLLMYYQMTGDSKALDAVTITLDRMARGGIYDQLGGGFARYSVDAQWLAPHFEKMMYDNGQLVSLYSEAYQITQNPRYKEVIEETIGWLDREMTHPDGGFYSSLDADSEGEEGKFYVWSEEEINSLLDPETVEIYKAYYNILPYGNWEEKNILYQKESHTEIAEQFEVDPSTLSDIIGRANAVLFEARSKRERPGLDDKILTSWNALMLTGLVDAFRATGEKSYLEKALKNGQFIHDNMLQEDGRLDRNFKDGKTKINAFLDDYAFLIEAYINLYEVTFDEKWILAARDLADYTLENFYNEESDFFNYTSKLDPPLIAQKMELGDNVIPGSNSAMARNLNFLYHYFESEDYLKKSDQMLFNMIGPIIQSKQTSFYSNWTTLYLEKLHPTYEVAILGERALEKSYELQREFHPNTVFMGGQDEGSLPLLKDKLQHGRTMIYVCQNKVCQLPVEEKTKAMEQITYLMD